MTRRVHLTPAMSGDDLLPECAFPKCKHIRLPVGVMCNSHSHVSINPSYLEPAERNQP